MNEHDDLERTVARSLRQRTERISTSVPDLDGVWAHVDRRRSRRRHVAAVGSLAVVAAGAMGIATLGGGDPDRIPAPAASTDLQAAWRCTNQLDHFEEGSSAVFFATCEATEVDGSARIFDLPTPTTVPVYPTTTTIVCLAPTTAPATAPADAVATTAAADAVATTAPADAMATTVPCGWGPPPTTAPVEMMPTTTTIAGRSAVEQEYTVQPGDSLASIAERYGITLEQLINYNQFSDGADHLLLPGEQLLVPPTAVVPSGTVPVTTTTSMP